MKRKLISLFALCIFPFLLNAQESNPSSHHKLSESIEYPLSRVSPNGRYMGGWINGITYVYDTETDQTVTTLGGNGVSVYLVEINNDGSLWASRKNEEGVLQYGLYKDGTWTDLPKPEGFAEGWLRDVTSDGKYTINSYTNTLEDLTLVSDAFLYTRQEDGSYTYKKLIKPKNDCWTESEVFHVDPMQISYDGKIILGHMVDGLSFYIFPIIWERNENGEYDYRIKGESFCFHLDQPAPGNPPVEEEMITATPGTPEYEEQLAQYNEAVENWNALANAYFTGQALSGYPKMNNNGTIIGMNLFTGDPEKGNQPLLLSINDDSYSLIEYYFTRTKLVTDNGVAFFVNEFMDGIHHNIVHVPGNPEVIPFDKWLKSEYGLTLEPEYNDGVRVWVGDPSLSEDGKTLAFTRKMPSGIYTNHYFRLNKSLNQPTSISNPEASFVDFHVYTNRKTLFINQDEPCDIRIIDIAGKTVASAKNATRSVNLNQLSAGVYVAAITCKGKTELFKVMLSD